MFPPLHVKWVRVVDIPNAPNKLSLLVGLLLLLLLLVLLLVLSRYLFWMLVFQTGFACLSVKEMRSSWKLCAVRRFTSLVCTGADRTLLSEKLRDFTWGESTARGRKQERGARQRRVWMRIWMFRVDGVFNHAPAMISKISDTSSSDNLELLAKRTSKGFWCSSAFNASLTEEKKKNMSK